MSENKRKAEKKRKEGIFSFLLGGRLFTSNILTKNAMLLGLIVVYCFFYVSNRYQHEKELVRIDKLTKRRNEIRNNLLVVKSEFARERRNSAIEDKLKENNIEVLPLSTPYIIYKDKQ